MTPSDATPAVRAGLFAIWALLAGYLVWHHVFWRDEVRAFSLALAGADWRAMLRGVHGEGHPALWYLLLRGAHDLLPVKQVLPAMAALIGGAAAAVIAWRAPFRPWLLALVLFGAFCLFEYTVSARNYGLSLLVLVVLADRLARGRDRPVATGLLLALLCNTNVHSVFLAGALLLFRAIELLGDDGWRWTARWRGLAVSAALAAVGAGLCFATVYPPANDAAVLAHPGGVGVGTIAHALLAPALSFSDLAPVFLGGGSWVAVLLALALYGAPFGLLRAPAAFLSSLAVLVIFLLFFDLVYPGGYRHQALYLAWLVAMYWLVLAGRGGHWPAAWRARIEALAAPRRIGQALFVVLLALQIPNSVAYLVVTAQGIPQSRARDLAALLRARGLERAVLVADPDVVLEPMPYYAANPLFLLRSGRFGQVVPFTRRSRASITLPDMLATMRTLRARTGRPVVAVLQHRLDATAPVALTEGYYWHFSTTPAEVRAFEAATDRIAAFDVAVTDESYYVYRLR